MTEPIDVSDSQIKKFLECARYWGYTKLLKLDPAEDKDNLILGDAFHSGAEHYVLNRDFHAAEQLIMQKIIKGNPTDREWQLQIVPAMFFGWATHWLPKFEQEYEIIKPEEEFKYHPHPLVHYRGKKDLKARKRSTGGIWIWDYKTSGQSGGGDLAKEAFINRQLALYAIDEMRKSGTWPEGVGLAFVQKPKKEGKNRTIMDCVNDARNLPSNYHSVPVQVTPRFAGFAIGVEASDVLLAQQMLQFRELFRQRGVDAFEFIPANFSSCFSYGRKCGFADGCHSGNPCHRTIKQAKKP